MAKNYGSNFSKKGKYEEEFASETNVQQVKQQNAQAAQGTYNTEFASETNVEEVKKQNARAEQNKK
ncbi:gamma-type small acid-soluble spore protein [Aciduricibacillus chroicocephali]|uniref:Small, acid-soluble spore protein gamma-type n=1 Tax=Aciduricibacillus chroicocephali TaxID=3054939 RepID=A0ABY9KXQ9_9BACI|nr:gamma-type small acid-soluble spore protein [Bacillaceae bacterium 44XB]